MDINFIPHFNRHVITNPFKLIHVRTILPRPAAQTLCQCTGVTSHLHEPKTDANTDQFWASFQASEGTGSEGAPDPTSSNWCPTEGDTYTLRPRQNGCHFADDTFKHIFLNENVRISIKISLKLVPKGPLNNNPALVQIKAWRRSGDKPLSQPMMASLLTHICITWPQQSISTTQERMPSIRNTLTIPHTWPFKVDNIFLRQPFSWNKIFVFCGEWTEILAHPANMM